jgi:hypothetical protein
MIKTISVALLAMTLAACGDGASDADAFIGSWMYNAGSTQNTDCPDNTLDSVDPQTGTFQIAEGIDSDLIVVPVAGDKCPAVKYDANGKIATIKPSQTCAYTENTTGGAVMVMGAYTTGTYTLSADGKSATGGGTGSVTFTGAGGTITCSVTITLAITKTGN